MKENHSKRISVLLGLLVSMLIFAGSAVAKPNPAKALELLRNGNERFVSGTSLHPNIDLKRLIQAGKEDQGDHAYATVITCSDSRVPVERIFDAGVMDTFVIRVAGNVIDGDEAGSIEYGLAHVKTPVLVVLGHTQCGAVTAVTHAVHGTGHALELNIPPLVDNIEPAVRRAIQANPQLHGDEVIPAAIVENVWQGIEDLFMTSPSTRELFKSGAVKVIGAIYDVGTGKVNWLSEEKVASILSRVETNPTRAMDAMAEGEPKTHQIDQLHQKVESHQAQNGLSEDNGLHERKEHSAGQITKAEEVKIKPVTLLEGDILRGLDVGRHHNNTEAKFSFTDDGNSFELLWFLLPTALVLFLVLIFGAKTAVVRNLKLGKKLYGGFGFLLLLAVGLGFWSYYFLGQVSEKSHLETAALELDMMAGEISTVKTEFILYGVSDKELGEKFVGEARALLAEYKTDIIELQQFNLEEKELKAIKELDSLVAQYGEQFENLVTNFRKAQEEQTDLRQFGQKLLEQVEELLREQEEDLAKIETAVDLDRKKQALQSELVEKFAKIEVLTLKLDSNQNSFLLDKDIKRVHASENYLGQLFGQIEMGGKLIKQQSVDSKKIETDMKILAKVEAEFEKYQEELGAMIVNTLKVDGGAVKLSSLLHRVEAIAVALSHRFKLEAESAKSEANRISLVLTILTVVLGLVVATIITRAFTLPILRELFLQNRLQEVILPRNLL